MWFLRRRGHKNNEATVALEEAKTALKEIKEHETEVDEVVKKLKNLRERNHFAEQMEDIITNRRGTNGR